ncbi:hypothetical protein, partial [Escherichia coli]|uniref:hypothetical protein n=1 Tax=Escherichia coli TaxID=562 RepID=UPI0035D4A462
LQSTPNAADAANQATVQGSQSPKPETVNSKSEIDRLIEAYKEVNAELVKTIVAPGSDECCKAYLEIQNHIYELLKSGQLQTMSM